MDFAKGKKLLMVRVCFSRTITDRSGSLLLCDLALQFYNMDGT
jgi:hypothetical protein